MMNRTQKTHSDTTLESLLFSLDRAVEAKKQNDEALDKIRESLTERIEEMKQAKAALDATMGARNSETTSFVAQSLWKAFREWVLPAIVLFALLWFVMWVLQIKISDANAETACTKVTLLTNSWPFMESLPVEEANDANGNTAHVQPNQEPARLVPPARNRLFNRLR